MHRSNLRAALRKSICFGAAAWLLGGCSLLTPPREPSGPARRRRRRRRPNPKAPRLAALETRHFELAQGQELIGETQVIFARYENTFSAIGRQYNLGYEEMRSANPGVDQWLPGEGTPIYLPTQSILPEAPREGIVVNVPAMRLYYFTTEKPGRAGGPEIVKVSSHPIGIGVEGWATPFGEAKVTQKARIPSGTCRRRSARSTPSAAIRCRASCRPGPDNPLGAYAMTLSLPGYLIHGTNKPAGVGMRSSHGCIRLYPEDIEALFARVARGTAVRLVNQPVLAGWRDGQLYLEVHPPLAEEQHDLVAEAEAALRRALETGRRRCGGRYDRSRGHREDRHGATRHSAARSARESLARAVSRERAHRREHRSDRGRRGDGAARGAGRECRAAEHALAHERAARRNRMIPIRDDNPVRGLPVVTAFLILTCMGVYLWQLSLPPEAQARGDDLARIHAGRAVRLRAHRGRSVGVAGGLDLHGDVPARRVLSPRRQHALPVDLRGQRRGPRRPRPVRRLLSDLRRASRR